MDFKNSLRHNTDAVSNESKNNGNLLSVSDNNGITGFDFFLTPQGGLKGTSKSVHYRMLFNENSIWQPDDGPSTLLTRDKLEEMVYHMSFQYGSATKAVRLIPIIHYSKKVAGIFLGYLNYLRGGRGNLPSNDDSALDSIMLEDVDDDEKKYLRINRDGTTAERKKLVRKEMNNGSNSLPSEVKTTLLLKFSPYKVSDDCSQMKRQSPFRLHMSA
eukprot:CAMPEP_0197840494 /NCGR_PEP_ID=MMETSP1437-20131217/45641_1 /TAXON_ID=49252 ORGANISM="Eucampia antarctica, Strain CCMP1452" /NCGR_SAMPLE_ID=MMETSP1437 /ASSEMBLY_ACC=CAM_ASM_001096 /LENGTH=214 /DNA_ID=CAMNT_0043450117 /DNA_START=692 /DNA_END=1336 /DNA_ORIENTATION=-